MALVITTGVFQDPGLRVLRSPAQDAVVMAEVLGDPAIGGFDVKKSPDKAHHEVRKAIDTFLNGRSSNDVVVIYISTTSTPTGSPSPGSCASPAVTPPVRRVFPPEDWNEALPHVLAAITRKINPVRRERSCPRVVKRARHNNYRVKRPADRNIRHNSPPTIHIHKLAPRAA